MEVNENLREVILEAVNNQIKSNNPKEVKVTLKRLMEQGYSKFESKQYIGQCLIIEIFNAFKKKETYNEVRYIRNLKNLPGEPQE